MNLMSIVAVLAGIIASLGAILQSQRNRDRRLLLVACISIVATMIPVVMLAGAGAVGGLVGDGLVGDGRVGRFVLLLSLMVSMLAMVLVASTPRAAEGGGRSPIDRSPAPTNARPPQTQERLRRRNEELLEATNRLASVGGWELDLTTMELLWTAQTCRIHEVPIDHHPDLESAIAYYAPEGRGVIKAAVQASIKHGSSWDLELPLVTAKGRPRWVRAQGAAEMVDGKPVRLHGAFQDITERKEAEEALRASEKKYRRLYERTPAMLHSLDPQGRIITVSDYWLESMGYQRDEVIGRPILDFLTEQSKRIAREVCIPKFRKTRVLKDEELQAVKKDGSTIETLLSAVAERDADGRFTGTLVVVIDVTERKRAQEESRKHRDVLAHMTRVSTMGELVAGIAHEVKQPLYAITNFASAAAVSLSNLDPTQPAGRKSLSELKDWNQGVKKAAIRASEIINRLREFSRKDESRREEMQINDVIRDSIELVAFEARQCQVHVETQLDDQATTIHADRVQCEQVIVNLLHNAYEALADCDHARRVIVRTVVVDHCVELQVIDNGPGIAAEEQGKLFEAFHTTKAAGMGMGLAISQTIVEDHGGRLWGSSNRWGGATFHVTLPCHKNAGVPC